MKRRTQRRDQQVNAKFSKDERDALEAYAIDHFVSMSAVMRDATLERIGFEGYTTKSPTDRRNRMGVSDLRTAPDQAVFKERRDTAYKARAATKEANRKKAAKKKKGKK